jgi:hypothetical protein
MPKGTDISKILILGTGQILIAGSAGPIDDSVKIMVGRKG